MFDLQIGKHIYGGHSLGVKMASQFVYENPDLINELFFWRTSHPRDFDLSNRILPAIKLFGNWTNCRVFQKSRELKMS